MSIDPSSSCLTESSPSAEIYVYFRGLIASGQRGYGERLRTVRQTAVDFGVAAATAARAYKQLERDGFVISRTAAGTRVASSASVLTQEIVARIRELAMRGEREGVAIKDLIAALRVERSLLDAHDLISGVRKVRTPSECR